MHRGYPAYGVGRERSRAAAGRCSGTGPAGRLSPGGGPGPPGPGRVAVSGGRAGGLRWAAVLDAVRLGPDDDETEVTAAQVRDVVARLIEAGHWREGDPGILVVFDAGYDIARLAYLLAGLPVEVLGRLRSDRVLYFPPPPRRPGRGRPSRHGTELKLAHDASWPPPAATTITQTTPYRTPPDRPRVGWGLGPAAPPAPPPRRRGRPQRRRAPHHRRPPDPPEGRSPARRPRPQAGVAVVLPPRRCPRRRGPVVAGVLAPVRPRAHPPPVQAGPRLDRAEDPPPRPRCPVDGDDHRPPRAAPPRP